MGHRIIFYYDNPQTNEERFTELSVIDGAKSMTLLIDDGQPHHIALNRRSAIKLVREVRRAISQMEDES